jgi:RND family efflux transporter MFP subunit
LGKKGGRFLTNPQTIEDHKAGSEVPNRTPSSRAGLDWKIAALAVVIALAVVVGGILPRVRARSALTAETRALAEPTVATIHPRRSAPAQEIVLPANVQAYIDAPIYARTNGYLKRWYADIGAPVKAGQLLAEIDTPEVNQQLQQARADLATAQANLRLSQITAERYEGLLKTDSVSKQDTDNAAGDLAAKKATVESAQYNVKRLEDLQSFEKIYAPFDGIITARNTDIGALIDSGASGGSRTELFHIAQPDKLRVYVNVPEAYSRAAVPGLTAELSLAEYPDRLFRGTLVRTANAIDPATRTLLVEIQVMNPSNQLRSGSYAEVHLQLPGAVSAFVVPSNTLLFRSEGLRLATVDASRRVALVPVTLGHDFGDSVEVLSGLKGDETVILNPPDSIIEGEQVRLSQAAGAGGS